MGERKVSTPNHFLRSFTPNLNWTPATTITTNWTPGAPRLVVKDGKTMAGFLALVGVGSLAVCSLSIYFITVQKQAYAVAVNFLNMLDPLYAFFFELVNFMPLVSGLFVLGLIAIEMSFALASRRNAKRLEDFEEKIIGEHFHDKIRRYCGSATNCLFRLGYLALLGAIIMQTAGFAVVLGLFDSIRVSIETNTLQTSSDPLARSIANLQYSIYTKCCFEEGFSVQSRIEPCTGVPVTSCNIPIEFSQLEDELCVCYEGTNATYNAEIQKVEDFNMCSLLEDSIVQIQATDKVPGTSFPLTTLIPANEVRIVGFHLDPGINPDVTAPNPKGFGCGTGYVKGVQFLMYKLLEQTYYYAVIGGLVVSIVQLLVLCCMAIQFANSEEDEFYNTYAMGIETPRVASEHKGPPPQISEIRPSF